jgi:hypothetical protein
VFRAHVLLLSFAIFFLVPTSSLLKVLHIIFCITIFQSILFLFQLITGQIILLSSTPGSEVGTNTVEGFKEYTRFYNLPTYLNATLFYFLFVYNFKNKLYKVIILLIISVTIIAPLHRSYIISILCVISLYIFLKQQSGVKFIYLFIIGTLTYSLTFIEIINHRLNEAFSDISKTFSAKSINSIDPTENTLNFRVAHFYERFEYLLNKPDGWLFGIGLISDNSKEADRLRFETGLTNEKLNRVTQIDSADLVWSPLMLQTGLLGTILYGVLMFYMMYFFSKEKTNQYGVIGYLCIVEAFFVSMLGTDMIQNSFKIMIILLAVISSKIYRNEKSRQFNHNVHDSNKKYFYA